MARQPKYTPEFKAGCIALLIGAGYPSDVYALKRVADRTGATSRSLRRWWAKYGDGPAAENQAHNEALMSQLVTEKKLEIKELLGEIVLGFAVEVKTRIDEDDLADATLPQLMTALGIGIDKHQLVTGKPTARIATVAEELAETPEDERDAVIAEAQQIIRDSAMGSSGSEA